MTKLFCDLVMKGGITSGVVFPRAIHELSKTYRLKNIAGTSAGAIAAVLAAAAQYQENQSSNGKAFDPLKVLPDELAGPASRGKGTKLLELFQSTAETASLFDLALSILRIKEIFKVRRRRNTLGMRLKAWVRAASCGATIVKLLLFNFGPWPVVLALPGAAVAIYIAQTQGAIIGVALIAYLSSITLSVVGFSVGALIGIIGSVKQITGSSNLFGICTGMDQPSGEGAPALTTWLHNKIQLLAGRTEEDAPLTFDEIQDSDINLRAMTTCITHGRPYLLPFQKGSYFFDPGEFSLLFPESIVKHLKEKARELLRRWAAEGRERTLLAAVMAYPRLPLPRSEGLPILVAARMSLSFPILLSAVPMWTYDFRRNDIHAGRNAWMEWKKNSEGTEWFKALLEHASSDAEWMQGFDTRPEKAPRDRMEIERIWFSDGGICSNFPVHLFDQLIPSWPTFAINLRYHPHPIKLSDEERVKLAQSNNDEKEPYWQRMASGGLSDSGSLLSFLGGILNTMKDWADNTLMSVPGYPDRIAHVNLQSDEGGLNLEMERRQIDQLGSYGQNASAALVARFTDKNPKPGDLSWDNHRWTRLRSTLGVLQKQLRGLRRSMTFDDPNAILSYTELIERGKDTLPNSYKWSARKTQSKLANESLDTIGKLLEEIDKTYEKGFRDGNIPNPEPELQLRPPL
jgi:predicted acylesterase/phospholipase RssA